MVLVYLMGLADIFAAIMLVTGLRIDLILYFTIAMLAMKGIASFYGRINPVLYIMGAADLLAIVLLWQGTLWQLGSIIVMIMVAKGLISFWEIDLYRNTAINIIHVVYSIFKHVKKSQIANKLWFGRYIGEKENITYDYNYFYNKI